MPLSFETSYGASRNIDLPRNVRALLREFGVDVCAGCGVGGSGEGGGGAGGGGRDGDVAAVCVVVVGGRFSHSVSTAYRAYPPKSGI